MSLLAISPEVSQLMLEEMFAALEQKIPDPGPEEYDKRREDRKRELMQQMAFYTEEGPTFDQQGAYLCGTCYFRQLMDCGYSCSMLRERPKRNRKLASFSCLAMVAVCS